MDTLIVRADLTLEQHANGLLAVLDEYASLPHIAGRPLLPHVREVLPARLREQPGCHVLLALAGDEVVGAAVCFLGFSTFAGRPLLNVHDLAVREVARGQGIGRRLMAAAEELAIELRCCRVTLEVVTGNKSAIRLYERCGFKRVQQFWKKDLTIDPRGRNDKQRAQGDF